MSDFTTESAILHLREYWNDITNPIAFSGIQKLYDFYEGKLSKSQIKIELGKFESYSLMSETHQHKKKNVTISLHPRDSWQIDYFYVSELADHNDNIHYIFSAIDVFTKRGFCIPQVRCNGEASINSLKIIFNSITVRPKSIVIDGGKELNNKRIQSYLKKIGVKSILSKSNQKCSTVERFQKTIQRGIYMYISENETITNRNEQNTPI